MQKQAVAKTQLFLAYQNGIKAAAAMLGNKSSKPSALTVSMCVMGSGAFSWNTADAVSLLLASLQDLSADSYIASEHNGPVVLRVVVNDERQALIDGPDGLHEQVRDCRRLRASGSYCAKYIIKPSFTLSNRREYMNESHSITWQPYSLLFELWSITVTGLVCRQCPSFNELMGILVPGHSSFRLYWYPQ